MVKVDGEGWGEMTSLFINDPLENTIRAKRSYTASAMRKTWHRTGGLFTRVSRVSPHD